VFATATIGLLPSVIALLRGRAQAYVAGVTLLGNTFLIEHTSAQYADVPLMFFYVAAVALLVLHDEATDDKSGGRLLLAGLAAALAAWTKNEGLMFLAVMLAAHFAVVVHGSGWREYSRQLRLLAAGLLPVMTIVVYFKWVLAPPSDLAVLMDGQSLIAKLVDPGRYFDIASELGRRIVPHHRFGLGMACALALYGLCMGLGAKRTLGVAFGGLTLLLVLAGYFAVYVVTPYPLEWHMFTSIDRVLLQIWPMFVLVFFLLIATPQESFGQGQDAHPRTGAVSRSLHEH